MKRTSGAHKRPLEPYFLKRADRFVPEHLGEPFTVAELAAHCGVSWRTLEKAFVDFRGITPVAHVRNLRLDHARRALDEGDATISEDRDALRIQELHDLRARVPQAVRRAAKPCPARVEILTSRTAAAPAAPGPQPPRL